MYNPKEVIEIADRIIAFLATLEADPGIKMAACKTAASAIENTIAAQGLAVVLASILNGAK